MIPKNIIPCTRRFCICVEYMNITNPYHLNYYKHCMITDINNNKYKYKYNNYNNNKFNINKNIKNNIFIN